jgi:F-type H+-transporting ATPase subunit a
MEIFFEVIYNMVKENVGKEGIRLFSFIYTLFLFIACINIFGLIPYTFTPTSHFVITFGLSLSIFIGVLTIGLVNSKLNYISMFMPGGAPLVLGSFLTIVEIISHFAKPISLGLRLAANITAGHLLFAILASFV